MSEALFKNCGAALKNGGVIAYPTEAVWGLGCDPFNNDAVRQVLALKKRHADKGLIIAAASIEQIEFLLEGITPERRATLEQSWPGHTTWLIPHHDRVPESVHGVHPTVAVRVSKHPVVVELCNRFGGPIVSTSANPEGEPPATMRSHVQDYFANSDIVYASGEVGTEAAPSTIIDLATGKKIR